MRLIGHSRGGHIAFRVAQHHPELIEDLVLLEPGGELDESLGGAPPAGKQGSAFAKAAALIAEGKVEEGLTVVAEHTGGPGAWEKRSEARKAVNRDNATTLLGQINETAQPLCQGRGGGHPHCAPCWSAAAVPAAIRAHPRCAGSQHAECQAGDHRPCRA